MKMKGFVVSIVTILLLTIWGCASAPSQPSLTPLQIQALQSREFETHKHIGFASVISVLQDLGYIIQEADEDTGFITAKSPTSSKTDWLFTGNAYHSDTKVTAFVEEIRPGFTRIRLNFVTTRKVSGVWGQDRVKEKQILDAKTYEIAFDKIGEAIFVRSGTQGD